MPRWVRVAAAEEVPAGTGRTVLALDRPLALYNVEGGYYALDDACPHRGASLGEATVDGHEVTCTWHSWAFDVRNGKGVRMEGVAVRTYRSRVSGGDVEVEIPD